MQIHILCVCTYLHAYIGTYWCAFLADLCCRCFGRSGGGGGGGNDRGEKTQMLEQKVYKLQDELTELHRKKGEVEVAACCIFLCDLCLVCCGQDHCLVFYGHGRCLVFYGLDCCFVFYGQDHCLVFYGHGRCLVCLDQSCCLVCYCKGCYLIRSLWLGAKYYYYLLMYLDKSLFTLACS